jgi:predicted enzyme related to lactoylglutathione lyase
VAERREEDPRVCTSPFHPLDCRQPPSQPEASHFCLSATWLNRARPATRGPGKNLDSRAAVCSGVTTLVVLDEERDGVEVNDNVRAVISTGGFTHVHLVVRDLAKSKAFYETVFGAEEFVRLDPQMAFLRLPGTDTVIALREASETGRIDHFGLAYEADIDAAVEAVEHAGGRLIERGERHAGMGFAYLADPDGNVFELEPPPRAFLKD